MITNYGLPPAAFRFIAVPLYATGSKKWNGIADISYNLYPEKKLGKITFGLSGMRFSKSEMLDSNLAPHFEQFTRIVPTIRLTAKSDPLSTREMWLEAKSFLISETRFSKYVQKASNGLIYVDSLTRQGRYINQLTFSVTNDRALYPYAYMLQMQQAQTFFRFNITGSYFFNYANGGGTNVRLFFSKFGYLTSNLTQRFATLRYQPKLLGVTGDEDYTYSSYFLGRTASYANDATVIKNSGLEAQQIMLRDGAFKMRLDHFEFLQGRSDNWVTAINLNTTLPYQIIPKQIPLKLFLDIGTYAGAKNSTSLSNQILYVGGLQLSLLKEIITLYAPVVYSSDFRNNLKSLPEQNTFLKRLTFSINLSQISIQRLTGQKFSL